MSSQDIDVTDEKSETSQTPAAFDPRLRISGLLFDLLICGVLAAVGIWFVVGALAMPGGKAVFNAGTFPAIVGAGLTGLALIQIVLSLKQRSQLSEVAVRRPVWLALAMVLIVLFPSAVDRMGYYPVAVIWVPAFGWIAGIRKPLGLIVATAIVLLLAKFVFEMLLGTPLP